MEHFPHADEFLAFRVDILLVDLVGKDGDAVLVAQFYDVLQVFALHNLASGISGVDDDDGSWNIAFFDRSFNFGS